MDEMAGLALGVATGLAICVGIESLVGQEEETMLFSSITGLLAFDGIAEAFLVGTCIPVVTYTTVKTK